MPLIHDWSNRHIIYTAGYSEQQAERMAKDPRAYATFLAHGIVRRHHEPIKPHPVAEHGALQRDWAVSLGDGLLQGSEAIYPAKYSFDVNAPPSCTNDFMVYPVPATRTGSSRAKVVGTFTDDPTIGQTSSITITPAGSSPVTLILTAGTTNSGTTFAVSGTNNTTTDAANMAAAINRNLSGVALDEIAAVASSGAVTAYALTTGTGVTLSTANTLSNFSWGSVTAGAKGSQANHCRVQQSVCRVRLSILRGLTPIQRLRSRMPRGGDGVDLAIPLARWPEDCICREWQWFRSDPSRADAGHRHGIWELHEQRGNSPDLRHSGGHPRQHLGSNATDYMLPLALVGGLSSTDDRCIFLAVCRLRQRCSLRRRWQRESLFRVACLWQRDSGTQERFSGCGRSFAGVAGGGCWEHGQYFCRRGELARVYNVTSRGVVEGYIPIGIQPVQSGDGPFWWIRPMGWGTP